MIRFVKRNCFLSCLFHGHDDTRTVRITPDSHRARQHTHTKVTAYTHTKVTAYTHTRGHSAHAHQGHSVHAHEGHSAHTYQGHSTHAHQGHSAHTYQGHSAHAHQGHGAPKWPHTSDEKATGAFTRVVVLQVRWLVTPTVLGALCAGSPHLIGGFDSAADLALGFQAWSRRANRWRRASFTDGWKADASNVTNASLDPDFEHNKNAIFIA